MPSKQVRFLTTKPLTLPSFCPTFPNTMKRLSCILTVLGLMVFSGCSTFTKPVKPVIAQNYLDKGFTPWMALSELHEYFVPLDARDAQGKNYWDHKHWMTAVQGRWADGGPQFRFQLSSAPHDRIYGWYWYFNMDAAAFHSRLSEFSEKHFKLVYHNTYAWPDGSLHYSAVWQKFYAPGDPKAPRQ